MFWIGILVGLFVGVLLGLFCGALLASASRSDYLLAAAQALEEKSSSTLVSEPRELYD
jgi:hypothetical protein